MPVQDLLIALSNPHDLIITSIASVGTSYSKMFKGFGKGEAGDLPQVRELPVKMNTLPPRLPVPDPRELERRFAKVLVRQDTVVKLQAMFKYLCYGHGNVFSFVGNYMTF